MAIRSTAYPQVVRTWLRTRPNDPVLPSGRPKSSAVGRF